MGGRDHGRDEDNGSFGPIAPRVLGTSLHRGIADAQQGLCFLQDEVDLALHDGHDVDRVGDVHPGDVALDMGVDAIEAEMGAKIFWTAVDLLGLDGRDPTTRSTIQAFLDSARGLGLAAIVGDDARRRERVTQRWAEMIDELLPRQPRTDGSSARPH